MTARIGIVTVSDRASRGEYEDRGGPTIRDYFVDVLTSPFEAVARVIPDEQSVIERTLRELCEVEGWGGPKRTTVRDLARAPQSPMRRAVATTTARDKVAAVNLPA